MACTHDKFDGNVDVKRIEDRGPGRFLATVNLHCAQCGMRFRFVGNGVVAPLINADATELRVPIQPIDALITTGLDGALSRRNGR